MNQVDEIIDQLHLSKNILNESFNFPPHQKNYTQYVVTSNPDLCMRRCYKFEVYDCQNVCTETLIAASKFKEKYRSRSEDINKIKTEFLRSGFHSGLQLSYTLSIFKKNWKQFWWLLLYCMVLPNFTKF